jgi:hypothetical protein
LRRRPADVDTILDEVQMSYGDDGLWLGLIKSLSGRCYGPRIAVFYYGSPTGGPHQLQQESHMVVCRME